MLTSYTIDEARAMIKSSMKNIQENFGENNSELVALTECHGRILAADILSESNVPGFKRSTMDGYAVCHSDLLGAEKSKPCKLKLAGRVEMGRETHIRLHPGQCECAYIPTGGMLPEGADSVLMVEHTNTFEKGKVTVLEDGVIEAYASTFASENIIFEDEDVKRGEVVLKKGKRIRPYEMGVLSSIGKTTIPVFKRLKIGILITGDEIVTPFEVPKPGQVRDINSYLMQGLICSTDSLPITYHIKSDDLEQIYTAVETAVCECDILLVSGGSSVGVKDFTRTVFERLPDSELVFHGLALKPGKPTLVSRCGSKLLFGMPGHPLSCAVVFNTLVKYYIELLHCSIDKEYPVLCELTDAYTKAKGREEYIPVCLHEQDGRLFAEPISGKSGIISTFAKAYGYFRTDKEQTEVKKGDMVQVQRI